MDYIYAGPTNFYELDGYDQYWTCVYNAILMLNGNELGPRDQTQLIFVSAVLVSSAMINGNIFGNMALIVSELNKKSASFYGKLDIANTAMNNLKLPAATQKRVINYILYTSSSLEQQREQQALKSMLSPSLKFEITKTVFSQVLVKNALFTDSTDILRE